MILSWWMILLWAHYKLCSSDLTTVSIIHLIQLMLNPCLMYFTFTGRYLIVSVDLATSCYEYACGKFPNHLDLMMGLFNCYVREYSFVKQQQVIVPHLPPFPNPNFPLYVSSSATPFFTEAFEMFRVLKFFFIMSFPFLPSSSSQTAIKMYKLAGEERFLLWAVCSIQLQVLLAVYTAFLALTFTIKKIKK